MTDQTPDTTRHEWDEQAADERNEHAADERRKQVPKPRDLTTRRTRRWKRGLALSATALGIAVVARRLRGRGGDRGETTADAAERAREPATDGPGLARRLVVGAVAAAFAAAVKQRGGAPVRER